MQAFVTAIFSDRKPEGKSVTSSHIDSGVCCHIHFFGFNANKNA